MNSKCSDYIMKCLKEVLGADFVLVKNTRAMQMRLFVFVNSTTHDVSKAGIKATGIETENENTGLGRILANKGGQAIKLTLKGTSLCFLSCHLSAHEGGKHLASRNEDCREILSGIDLGQKGIDFASQFHHCFWMGDMNYRVDLSQVAEYKHLDASGKSKDEKKALQKEKFEIASGLVTKLDGADRESALATLHEADELSTAMAKDEVLVGFEELPGLPTFHPTFKVHRWEAEKYVVKRTPSYCDRILVKSLPGFKSCVDSIAYEACPTYLSSDHKPIRAGFSIKKADRTVKLAAVPAFTVTVSDIKVSLVGRVTTKADVPDIYVRLLADPTGVIKESKGSSMKTKQASNTIEHSFEDVLKAAVTTDEGSLDRCHMFFSVMDRDTASKDDELGSVSLCLGELSPMVKYDFSGATGNLTLNGLRSGTFSCSVLLTPVTNEELATSKSCCTIL